MIWQPIETAPKDGTHILLRYYKSGKSYRTIVSKVYVVTEGYFDPSVNRVWNGNEFFSVLNHWVDALGRLIQDTEAKKSKSIVTHWMPLPEEPEEPD